MSCKYENLELICISITFPLITLSQTKMNLQTKSKDEEELGVLHIIILTNNYCSHRAFKVIHHMDVRAGIIGSVTKQ
jgi:hypothetical protein